MPENYGRDEHEDWPRRQAAEGTDVQMVGRVLIYLVLLVSTIAIALYVAL